MSSKYNYLKTELQYDRVDFWKMLKALLPRGPIWRIRQPIEQDIRLNSIPSSESFGTITVSL